MPAKPRKEEVKFGNIADLQTNTRLELGGIRYDLGRGRYLTVRRAGGSNHDFSDALRKAMRPHELGIRLNKLSDRTANEIMMDVFAKTVVINWGGFLDPEGKPIRFSEENAVAFFRAAPDEFRRLQDVCMDRQNFKDEV